VCVCVCTCDATRAAQASVERTGSGTLARFTRDCGGAACTSALPRLAIVAVGDTDALSHHTQYGFATFSVSGGDAVVVTGSNRTKLIKTHAWLMVAAWGFFIPAAVIVASTLKSIGPFWCSADATASTAAETRPLPSKPTL
jgi:hypothetical protein